MRALATSRLSTTRLVMLSILFLAAACDRSPVESDEPVAIQGSYQARGGKAPPSGGQPQLVWTIDDSQDALSNDGDATYSHTHPDLLADIDGGRARLYTNQGKRRGKHQDPERQIQIDITGTVAYSSFVHASAQTKDVVDVESIAVGSTIRIPFRIRWSEGGTLYTLRYGRECGANVVVGAEQAEITRHDASSYTLRSFPDTPARLCIDDSEHTGVLASFSWDFVIDDGS